MNANYLYNKFDSSLDLLEVRIKLPLGQSDLVSGVEGRHPEVRAAAAPERVTEEAGSAGAGEVLLGGLLAVLELETFIGIIVRLGYLAGYSQNLRVLTSGHYFRYILLSCCNIGGQRISLHNTQCRGREDRITSVPRTLPGE